MADKPPRDIPGRGKTEKTPLGRAVFAIGRSLDPFIQYGLLSSSPLTVVLPKLGLTPPVPPPNSPIILSTGLGAAQSILLVMSVGSAVKQIFTVLFISKEPCDPSFGVAVSIVNYIFNSANTLVFLSSPLLQILPTQLYIGSAIYTVGIFLETFSEIQRRIFKDKPENQGKAFTGGLFGLARHINYGGFIVWRSAYAFAAGGPIWGAVIATLCAYDFTTRAVPVLDRYCEGRYGEQWRKFRITVPYNLLPWVY